MGRFPTLSQSKWTLKQRLFVYMLLLAAILLFALASGLLLLGRFRSTQEDTIQTLSLQMEVFKKDMASYWEDAALLGVELSENLTGLLETGLTRKGLRFGDLSESQSAITELQDGMILPLRQALQKSSCSGAFVLLDTTVNPSLEGSFRSGLYLQKAGGGKVGTELLLYRGSAEISKRHGLMLHRKWRLEFQLEHFPEFEGLLSQAALPLEDAYRITEPLSLPGTSDQAVLLTVPMIGRAGRVYGLCGFEINKSYFKSLHAQPSHLDHLICLLASGSGRTLDADVSLSCGITKGYYYEPKGTFAVEELSGDLRLLSGRDDSYVGLVDAMSLADGKESFTLAALIPKADYDRALLKSHLQGGLLLLLLLSFSVVSCLYFSQRFLSPILRSLEQLKAGQFGDVPSPIAEIDDLFAFLQEQDRLHEDTLTALEGEKARLQTEYEKARKKYESTQAKLTRLEQSREPEVDSEEYQHFLAGISSLTPMERTVFHHYLAGKKVKEIIAITGIKESTLRYHNQNIYGKLGVHSLKQLLRYAALMEQEN